MPTPPPFPFPETGEASGVLHHPRTSICPPSPPNTHPSAAAARRKAFKGGEKYTCKYLPPAPIFLGHPQCRGTAATAPSCFASVPIRDFFPCPHILRFGGAGSSPSCPIAEPGAAGCHRDADGGLWWGHPLRAGVLSHPAAL